MTNEVASNIIIEHGALGPLPTSSIRGYYFQEIGTIPFDVEIFTGNYRLHKHMMQSSVANDVSSARPISYVRVRSFQPLKSHNDASENVTALALKHYEELEAKLRDISKAGENCQVEEGAARTALTVMDQLKTYSVAPPELSWHDNDAVVMLWALGDTTYAITITDGELGYVVRRNRKAIRIADSIAIDTFRIEQLG